MLFVFAQLFQNSIFYYIVNNKKSLIKKQNKLVNPFKSNQIKDLKVNEEQLEDDDKEFLHSFISVQLDKDNPDYLPMKYDLVSRLIFWVLIIFFLAIYFPNSFKRSFMYNLFKH